MMPQRGSWLRRARERRNGLQRMARLREAERIDRLLFLAQLAGRLGAANFTPAELLEAEAALREPPRARQSVLPLHGSRS